MSGSVSNSDRALTTRAAWLAHQEAPGSLLAQGTSLLTHSVTQSLVTNPPTYTYIYTVIAFWVLELSSGCHDATTTH